jgi:transcriptional regulator with XRE-family HTH domain
VSRTWTPGTLTLTPADPVDRDIIDGLLRDARAMRLQAGIRQVTVGRALGLNPAQVSYWERGVRGVRVKPRSLRYLLFLAGLRRALANQAAAAAMLTDPEVDSG